MFTYIQHRLPLGRSRLACIKASSSITVEHFEMPAQQPIGKFFKVITDEEHVKQQHQEVDRFSGDHIQVNFYVIMTYVLIVLIIYI